MKLTDTSAELITRRPALVLLMIVVLTVTAIYGYLYQPPPASSRVANDSNGRNGKNSQDQANQGGRRLTIARARDPHAILVIETDEAFTAKGVAALRKIAAELESLPYVDEVMWLDSIPTLNVFGLRENVLPPEDATPERFRKARDEVMRHPLISGQLLSDDGRTLLMTVVFDWLAGPTDEECSDQLLATARDTARAEDLDARIRVTGLVPLYIAHKQAFDRNQQWFQRLSYVLVAVISIVLFRGLAAVCIVAIAPAVGIFWTLGILNLLDDRSNPLTNIVLPVLLTMVGLADGVHLMVHIRKRRADGERTDEAARSAIRHVGAACALTSLTTAAGFASLMVADSEFVRQFGRACAMGVLVTFVAVITVIPLLCLTPLARNIHLGQERDLVGQAMNRCSPLIDRVVNRSGLISLLAVAATLVFAVVAFRLRPDDKMKNSQPTGSAAYQALEHCDRELGGIETIRVEIRWTSESDPTRALMAVSEVEQMVASEPLLRHPLSILGILSSLPGDEAPTSRAAFVDLLPTSVRRSWFDMDAGQARVTVRIQDLGIARYEPVFQRLETGFEQLKQAFPGYTFKLAGDPVRRGRSLYVIVADLAASLGTASVIIFAMMAVAYRSFRLGLISIVPNLFPLVVTASVLVLLGHPLEIASVCSFTVCLGIAVDDTIHFLTRYQQELGEGGDIDDAIRRSFVSVGTAMVITTVIMMVGFGSVLGSDMPSHRSFAAMAVSTIGAALIGDLIFLPALLSRFAKRPAPTV